MDDYHRAFLYASVEQFIKDEKAAAKAAKNK